jgi:hypothetical protein
MVNTISEPFNEYYYDGLKRFFNYMLGHPSYMACEKAYLPKELEGISVRYKALDKESVGTKHVHFLNKNYFEDAATFFMSDDVINFDLRKMTKRPDIHFEVECMKARTDNAIHFHSMVLPGVTVYRNNTPFIYQNTSPSERCTIQVVLDMISEYTFDEICYCVHNKMPIYIS